MRSCGFTEKNFIPGDPYATAFNEGRRSVILDIFKMLKYNEVAVQQLMEADDEME